MKIMKKLFALQLFFILCFYSSNLFSQASVGQQAPTLEGLKLIDKQLPDLGNKFVFIDFWATWCAPCRQSLPHVNTLAEKYKDKVVFLAVSDENENTVRPFLQKNSFSSLIFALDIQKNLFSKLDIKAIPYYCLISPQNTILASGYSSTISDSRLDSIITHYNPSTATTSSIKITQDSLQKLSSVEICETPGARKFLSQSGYTLVVRDSLWKVLPYLTGVKLGNKTRWQNIPQKMIEVKIFSRNVPFDSLKIAAHNQLLATYGITVSKVTETRTVWNFNLKNPKLLKNKETIVEPGVGQKNSLLNDSTYRLDNYSIIEMAEFLERVYFPRIFYVQTNSTEKYDWDLHIANPRTHSWVSFDELKTAFSKESGIEIKEGKRDETITVYNKMIK